MTTDANFKSLRLNKLAQAACVKPTFTMVRLTADVILNSHARINPCSDRELDLRGLKIPVIENIGTTQDQFDVLDFTDNEIKKLENFPRCKRLSGLLLSNNHISRISTDLGEQILNLESLTLTNNRVENLTEIDNLAASC